MNNNVKLKGRRRMGRTRELVENLGDKTNDKVGVWLAPNKLFTTFIKFTKDYT